MWRTNVGEESEGPLPAERQELPHGDSERPNVAARRHPALEVKVYLFWLSMTIEVWLRKLI